MRWRWVLGVPLVLATAGCIAVIALGHIEANERWAERTRALSAALTKHGEAFRADVRTTSALPIFDPIRPMKPDAKDAGAFLRKHVPHVNNAGRTHEGPVPSALAAQLGHAVFDDFPRHSLDVDVRGVDLSWMRALADFDRWELSGERPIGFETTLMQPSPADLQTIARVRLLQGIDAGALGDACRDVDALARLLASTEHGMTVLSATAVLVVMRQAYDHAVARGLDVEGCAPPTEEQLRTARRALVGWLGALDYHVDYGAHRALLDELLTAPDLHAGRCAGLSTTAMTLLEVAGVGGDRYDAPRAWLLPALERTRGTCRLVLAREAWTDPDDQAVILVGAEAFCDPAFDAHGCVTRSFFGMIPGLRDAVFEEAMFRGHEVFDRYEKRR